MGEVKDKGDKPDGATPAEIGTAERARRPSVAPRRGPLPPPPPAPGGDRSTRPTKPAPARPKPAGPKPAAPKPAAPKPAAPKPAAPKPAEPSPAGPEPAGPKPAAPKPAAATPDTPAPTKAKREAITKRAIPAVRDAEIARVKATRPPGPPSEDSEPESVSASSPPADTIPPPVEQAKVTRRVGRCQLFVEIAHGGMATVYMGRWVGAGGFAKTVAVKALHPQYARAPEFVSMFLDEARVVARVRHANVMPIVDLVDDGGELFIVMDYVNGVTLAHLLRQMKRRKERVPVGIAVRILHGMLEGLHAAHEAKNERGEPLSVIHRDVTPENVLIGEDGYPKLIDFGIATALGRVSTTAENLVKGKPSYLAPEQIMREGIDRRTDIYSASVVLWEALTGRRMIRGDNLGAISFAIVKGKFVPPGEKRPAIPRELDAIVEKGLSANPDERFATADEMAAALEELHLMASHREVGAWVREVAAKRLERGRRTLAAVEAVPLEMDDSGPAIDRSKVVLESNPEIRRSFLESMVDDDKLDGDADDSVELSSRPNELVDDPPSLGLETQTAVTSPFEPSESSGRRRPWLIGGLAAAVVGGVVLTFALSGDETDGTTQPAASARTDTAPPVDTVDAEDDAAEREASTGTTSAASAAPQSDGAGGTDDAVAGGGAEPASSATNVAPVPLAPVPVPPWKPPPSSGWPPPPVPPSNPKLPDDI